MQATITEKDLIQLTNILSKHPEQRQVGTVHGFIVAVLSSLGIIKTEQWMGFIITQGYPFETEQEMEEILELIMRFYNYVANMLYNSEFNEIILVEDGKCVNEKNCSEEGLHEWSKGYMLGMSMDVNWSKEAMHIALPMAIFSGLCDVDSMLEKAPTKGMSAEKIRKIFRNNLPMAAQDVYNMNFESRIGAIKPPKEKDKIGRNEKCSCGSGKKYKKCCLLSGNIRYH